MMHTPVGILLMLSAMVEQERAGDRVGDKREK